MRCGSHYTHCPQIINRSSLVTLRLVKTRIVAKGLPGSVIDFPEPIVSNIKIHPEWLSLPARLSIFINFQRKSSALIKIRTNIFRLSFELLVLKKRGLERRKFTPEATIIGSKPSPPQLS
jgi:hypothetical protein